MTKALEKISEQKPVYRYALYSQGLLYITLSVCILLTPASLAANGGISYFGHHRPTVTIFVPGMLASAYFLWRAQRSLAGAGGSQVLRRAFGLIIPGMVGIAIAPAIGNGWLDSLHRIFGTLVFVTELVLAAWLSFAVKRDWLNEFLLTLQVAGGLIALIYLSPPQGFSIQGQILFQAAFSAVLFRSLKRVPVAAARVPQK